MVTVPYPEEKEPTKIEHLQTIAHKALHDVVAPEGSPSTVRRTVFTLIAAVAILVLSIDSNGDPLVVFLGGLGLGAVLLNALTEKAPK